jgi:hypothetical protein
MEILFNGQKNEDQENLGPLSPIGNPYMKDEVEDNFDQEYFNAINRKRVNQNSSHSKAWTDDLDFDHQVVAER